MPLVLPWREIPALEVTAASMLSSCQRDLSGESTALISSSGVELGRASVGALLPSRADELLP